MNQSMINSAVTMGQVQQKLNTIGHNLANANTTGYKQRDTSFADLLFQQVNNQPNVAREIGRQTPNGIRVGSGGAVVQTAVRFQQGAIQETGRQLDVALTEPGYFFELSPTETGERRFTRDGAFYLSPNPNAPGENNLVNSEGEFVLAADGNPISIPGGFEEFTITDNGTIQIALPDGTFQDVAQLQLVNITKPQLLVNLGDNNFTFPNLDELGFGIDDVLEESAGTGVFQQSALEGSNVDLSKEMTNMLEAQRFYQFNSQAISITDQMMGLVSNLR
ncbi:flagellar hook-basal body protein [Salipaludibacillus agaradhaerens]|uniref:Flagellar hook-basal body protein n=1 Tax=Salipaludibacillus agaradhaerens TaxID=76935 RepID=A0A9Q4B5Y2_SALAG|nr:flagellar hook-basal body protein [Salipaludibacillus agaradhaerens]MCR6098530.1 flagellar hook-basal body protein [Salipaludibacillus agaradhaerens]MCR6115537.1 flagellar hook-basal body protein [Salipaludibacillus agaradhaerens]